MFLSSCLWDALTIQTFDRFALKSWLIFGGVIDCLTEVDMALWVANGCCMGHWALVPLPLDYFIVGYGWCFLSLALVLIDTLYREVKLWILLFDRFGFIGAADEGILRWCHKHGSRACLPHASCYRCLIATDATANRKVAFFQLLCLLCHQTLGRSETIISVLSRTTLIDARLFSMTTLLETCEWSVVTIGSAVANIDCVRVRYAQLANLVKLRFSCGQLIRRLTPLGRFKLTALFEAKTKVVLALCRCRFRNNWPIKGVIILNWLLNATFILRCVVHFECAKVEIRFDSIHISFNVFCINFHLFRRHEVRLFFFIWLNVAVLESGAWDVIALLGNIGLAEFCDERHALGPGLRVVRNTVVREIVFSRCLSLPGIRIAHVNITLSSPALLDLLKCANIPFLLRHNFVQRTLIVKRFWIIIPVLVAELKVWGPNILSPRSTCLFGDIFTDFFDGLVGVLRTIWVPWSCGLQLACSDTSNMLLMGNWCWLCSLCH